MKEIETLKQLVYEKGLQTLLKRMEVVLSCRDLRTLTSNVIVSVTIVDMDAVVRKIKIVTVKTMYTVMNTMKMSSLYNHLILMVNLYALLQRLI